MKITFLVNEVFNGWSPTDTRLGGTEESVVRWAEELVKRKHQVIVFNNGQEKPYNHKGVYYAPRNYYINEYEGGADICLNVKSSKVAPKEPTLYLTNETDAGDLDLSKYLGVIWPSSWALENIPVNNSNLFVLPHGYDNKEIYPAKKNRKQCFYASSPDRGLMPLLQAWPKIYKAHPDAQLFVTYGAEEYDIEGVTFLGEVSEEQMNQLYRESEYWLHPCTGGELYGITGMKAQASGCWPVYVPTMALEETVKYGTKSTFETFAKDTIEALNTVQNPPTNPYPTWETSTDRLLEIISGTIKT